MPTGFEVTQAIERGQLKETDEDSNEDGIIEFWEMSGVGVSVETKLREEDLGENSFLTKLPVQRQLNSSAKIDERVDEFFSAWTPKKRARSSVVLCPGDAATPNPLTSSAGSTTQIGTTIPPDVLLLYLTLVSGNAVPTGYEKEFATLERSIQNASKSALKLTRSPQL